MTHAHTLSSDCGHKIIVLCYVCMYVYVCMHVCRLTHSFVVLVVVRMRATWDISLCPLLVSLLNVTIITLQDTFVLLQAVMVSWVYEYMSIWVWVYDYVSIIWYAHMSMWYYMSIWVYEYMNIWVYEYMSIWVYAYCPCYLADFSQCLRSTSNLPNDCATLYSAAQYYAPLRVARVR